MNLARPPALGGVPGREQPPPRAFGGKPGSLPAIFHVRLAQAASGGESARPVEIFHVLRVEGRGERALAAVASIQRGRVTRAQLRAAGFTRHQVARQLSSGVLIAVLPRVYAFGNLAPVDWADELAVLLYLRHDAVISHRSAAALWGMDLSADVGAPVHATIVGRDSRRHDGLSTHRVASLDSRDVRLRHGLPVTAPARSLIDHGASASAVGLTEAVGQARSTRLVSDAELFDALQRAPYRTGTAALNRLLASPIRAAITRSRLERRLLPLIDEAGLPRPETNTTINGHEVDVAWRSERLILETDGFDAHGGRAAFERDRARDQRHVARGFRVIRVTWRQLDERPLLVVAQLAQALSAPGVA